MMKWKKEKLPYTLYVQADRNHLSCAKLFVFPNNRLFVVIRNTIINRREGLTETLETGKYISSSRIRRKKGQEISKVQWLYTKSKENRSIQFIGEMACTST